MTTHETDAVADADALTGGGFTVWAAIAGDLFEVDDSAWADMVERYLTAVMAPSYLSAVLRRAA